MAKEISVETSGRLKDAQIAGLLREADTLIRVGRYLAAESILVRAASLDPSSELVQTYRERIKFVSKQIPQRSHLTKDAMAEVQKTRAVLLQRKIDQANEYITKGKDALDEGDYKNALKNLQKALSIDTESVYAQALVERLHELEVDGSSTAKQVGNEMKFSSVLQEAWRQGVPTEPQEKVLRKLQEELKLSDGQRLALQRKIKNILYKDALRNVWMTGGISAFTPKAVDELRVKYAVSLIDHSALETEIIQEVRKNKVKGTVLVVDEKESTLLEIAERLRVQSYAVIAATSLEEAVTTVKTMTPEIALVEINFSTGPVGFDLYRQFRSNALVKDVPFYFMTTNLDRTTRLIGKRLGVDDFFTKPLDYELLFATFAGKLRGSEKKDIASKKANVA